MTENNSEKNILLTTLLVIIVGLFLFYFEVFSLNSSLDVYAKEIIEKCSASGFPPACYDEEVPELMDILSLEDVFAVTKLIQKEDRRYLYCHVLGHSLSEREMAKDPSKWKEVLSKAPPTFCNNGFLHGAMLARFNTDVFTDEMLEEIKPDLANVCENRKDRKFVGVEQSMCYHAVGHLNMYASNADPKKSVALCQEVAVKEDGRNFVQTCTEGVFMQIYQPLVPEDFALVAAFAPKSQSEAREYCSQFSGESYDACSREAWPLWREDIMKPGGVEKFCLYTDDDLGQRKCTAAIMNMVAVTFISDRNDFPGLAGYCDSLTEEKFQRRCFANSATRLIQIDPKYTVDAIKVCRLAEERGLEFECYRDLSYYGSFSFHQQSKEIEEYCSYLPKEWQNKCLAGNVSLREGP